MWKTQLKFQLKTLNDSRVIFNFWSSFKLMKANNMQKWKISKQGYLLSSILDNILKFSGVTQIWEMKQWAKFHQTWWHHGPGNLLSWYGMTPKQFFCQDKFYSKVHPGYFTLLIYLATWRAPELGFFTHFRFVNLPKHQLINVAKASTH